MTQQNRLFCFGLGYSCKALASALAGQGFAVAGTTRSEEKRQNLTAHGIDAYLFTGNAPLADAIKALSGITHLVISIPPSEAGDVVLNLHGDDVRALPNLRWVAYLSTTGVYGDHQGGWVNENTEVNPPDDRTKRRVAAENAWLGSGLPVEVFRLSGIYGPGRSAIDDVLGGEARRIDKPGQVFSRIHVEDIAATLVASINKPSPGIIYNVCDDEPAPSHEVVAYACELLNVTPPPLIPFEQAQLSEMARSFYASNRRVSNRRIKEQLGVKLCYPSYREGFKAIAKQMSAQ